MEIRPILSALLRSKTGAILVALQVAISLAILTNALHIVNVRQAVAARSSGLNDEASLFYIEVQHLVKGDHNSQLAEQKAEAATLRAVGGVSSVANTSQMPLSQRGSDTSIYIDRKQTTESARPSIYFSPDSLVKTFGLKLVEGRDLLPEEVVEIDFSTASGDQFPKSVVVTRALAAKVWPNDSHYVGQTLLYFGGNAARVVGVVERLQSHAAEVSDRAEYSLILPMRVTNGFDIPYAVRAEKGQRERVIKEAEAALRRASATPAILHTKTVDDDRKERYRADTALSWMLVTVSALLLLITASGIVGMASLWVTQRRKQIGVRRALGARRVDILRYFITENFMITSVGVLVGTLLAIGLNQMLVSRFGMAKLPLPYLVAGAGVFWVLGALAAFGPAWRAASISPATATRSA